MYSFNVTSLCRIKTTRSSPVQSVGTLRDGVWGVGRGMSRDGTESARGCERLRAGVTMSHLGG